MVDYNETKTTDVMSQSQLDRLQSSMEWSYGKLDGFRKNRVELIREYVGFNYGSREDASSHSNDKVPLPMIELAVTIYQQALAGTVPDIMVTPFSKILLPIAVKFELDLNYLVQHEIDFMANIELAVMDAFFGLGCVKKGLAVEKMIELLGVKFPVAQPFCEHVSLDNFVFDMTARNMKRCQYFGDRYPMIYEEAMDQFKGADKDKLKPSTDMNEQQSAQSMSSGNGRTGIEQFEETINLWDVYLPRQNMVVTMADDGTGRPDGGILNAFEWEGPDGGPYEILSFHPVPDNILPLAPASLWKDLHQLANRVFNKLGRQADRQKTLTAAQMGEGAQDAINVRDAKDGEIINVASTNNVKEMRFGGVDNVSLAFLLTLKDYFNYHAGNPELLGGLSAQADTLGQEQILSAGASKRLIRMKGQTVEFTSKVIRDLGFYIWNDPLRMNVLQRTIEGTGINIPVKFGPEDRKNADFYQFNIDINAHSMEKKSPNEKLAAIDAIFQKFIVPLMPMMQAYGIGVDVETLLRTVIRLSNTPELNNIITYANVMPNDMPGTPQTNAPAPANKTSTNIRVNRPGATRAGKDSAITQALMGQGIQNSVSSQIARPVS